MSHSLFGFAAGPCWCGCDLIVGNLLGIVSKNQTMLGKDKGRGPKVQSMRVIARVMAMIIGRKAVMVICT